MKSLKNLTNLDLIQIIQFCLKIYDLWRHHHLWVDVWVDGSVNWWSHVKITKYQGVKEFHMLARIGCYSKIMVFSPFKVKVSYYDPLHQCCGNTFNVLRLTTIYNGYKTSKFASNFRFPIITH